MGLYYSVGQDTDDLVRTPTVAYMFNTGEIWSIDTARLSYGQNIPFLEEEFKASLEAYANTLASLGIPGLYKWKVGLTGIKDKKISMPPPAPGKGYISNTGPTCVTDTIEMEGVYQTGQKSADALRPFFEELFDQCGMTRPAHLQ